MNLEQIKQAIKNGQKVYWKNRAYEIIKDKIGQYLIHCNLNDTYIGLTWADNKTLNGKESEFITN